MRNTGLILEDLIFYDVNMSSPLFNEFYDCEDIKQHRESEKGDTFRVNMFVSFEILMEMMLES